MENTILPAKYKLGQPEIDRQHGTIIGIISFLMENLQKKEINIEEIFNEAMEELSSYAKRHFEYEQKKMQKCNYPDFEEHVAKHELFKKKITDMHKGADLTKKTILIEIGQFLKDWFMEHINVEDRKFIDFYLVYEEINEKK